MLGKLSPPSAWSVILASPRKFMPPLSARFSTTQEQFTQLSRVIGSASTFSGIGPIPAYKLRDPLGERCVRTEPDRRLKIRDVGASLLHVARLRRQKFADRRTP